jgi:hypothetical protein
MNICISIDGNCRCLESYFRKMFILMQEAIAEEMQAPIEVQDGNVDYSQATYHSCSHFIKPDMLLSTYSLIDFWMKEICEHKRIDKKLTNSHTSLKKRKGQTDLDHYHEYLTKHAGLDLSLAESSLERLDDLRKVRNRFIHHGGHVPIGEAKEFDSIPGISVSTSLIVIDDSFVWRSLEHAKKYLLAAAKA